MKHQNRSQGFTRRWFIGGAAAFGAFGGCRFMEGTASSDRPLLRFGVVSDIHFVMEEGLLHYPDYGAETFVKTLEYFRDRGVDAVVCCGDMADRSIGEELLAVGRAWERVFPDNRAPDCRSVEKLFVTGNHDFEGFKYGENVRRVFPDPAVRAKHLIPNDFRGWWERAFHEEYRPTWLKEVNGYSFVGANYFEPRETPTGRMFNSALRDFYAANAKRLDPSRPFFHIQHPQPKDTCFAPWCWGRDDGTSTDVLSRFPNAIAFSGHSHYPLTDPRFLWQGAFTSVNASSLRYMGHTDEEFPRDGRPVRAPDEPDARHGQLWSVHADRIDVERRDFRTGLPIGETLTMPLPAAEPKPFAYAEHAKRLSAPEFLDGYAVTLEPDVGDSMRVLIPAVKPDSAARCYHYELRCSSGGKSVVRRVANRNAMLSEKDPRAAEPTIISLSLKDLPGQPLAVTVTPVGYFGKRGKSLSAVFSMEKWQSPKGV